MNYLLRVFFDFSLFFFGCISSFFFVFVFFFLVFSIATDASKVFLENYVSVGCFDNKDPTSCSLEVFCPKVSKEEIKELFHIENAGGRESNNTILLKIFEKKTLSKEQDHCIQSLKEAGKIKKKFNFSFFTNVDSTDYEKAGILTCLIGTLYSCLIASFFALIFSTIIGSCLFYFEKNGFFWKVVDFNIKILASVPPIMIGIFSSFFFIDLASVQRSSSLIAGLVLGISIFPMMTICVKQSIDVVAKNFRLAGLALGANDFQVFCSLIFPLAFKKIISGMLISISRIVGETTPMLAVGMVVFIKEAPRDIFDPTTTLPTQVFLWLRSSNYGFVSLASAGIVVMLFIISVVNIFSFFANKDDVF